jgi:hypothetical protein
MLHRVAIVRTDVSEEHSASIIRLSRIGELGTLAITTNWRMLRRNLTEGMRKLMQLRTKGVEKQGVYIEKWC